MSYLSQAGQFLIQTIFGLYIVILLLRIMLQLIRANFFNPVCQFIVKVTNPPLIPLRSFIPNWGRLDIPALLLAWVLMVVKFMLVLLLGGIFVLSAQLFAIAALDLVSLAVNIIIVVLIIQVILSWVQMFSPINNSNPVQPLLYGLSRPIVDPIRRFIPPMGGLDFSVLVALILLQLGKILILQPLYDAVVRL